MSGAIPLMTDPTPTTSTRPPGLCTACGRELPTDAFTTAQQQNDGHVLPERRCLTCATADKAHFSPIIIRSTGDSDIRTTGESLPPTPTTSGPVASVVGSWQELGLLEPGRCIYPFEFGNTLHVSTTIVRYGKGEKNSHTLYDVVLTVSPQTARPDSRTQDSQPVPLAAVESASLFEALRPGGHFYGLRVQRNYNHFEWLDKYLRAVDPKLSARLAALEIALPVEQRPRRLWDMSSWLSRRPDAGVRAEGLSAYLQALHHQVFCAQGDAARWTKDERQACSLLLKVWFSPDALFRPVRAALKHNVLYDARGALLEALARLPVASADEFEPSCGACLVAEHALHPDLRAWAWLAADKAALRAIGVELQQAERESARLEAARAGRSADAEQLRRLLDERAPQLRARGATTAACATELAQLAGWAQRLAAMQQGAAEEVLYLPNMQGDATAAQLDTKLMRLSAEYAVGVATHEGTAAFCAAALQRATDARDALARQLGGNRDVAELRLWLALERPSVGWAEQLALVTTEATPSSQQRLPPLSAAAAAGDAAAPGPPEPAEPAEPAGAAATQTQTQTLGVARLRRLQLSKSELRARLGAARGAARQQLSQAEAQLRRLRELDARVGHERAALGDEEARAFEARRLVAELRLHRSRENESRAAKLSRVGDDLGAREAQLARIVSACGARATRAAERLERQAQGRAALQPMATAHSSRLADRRRRVGAVRDRVRVEAERNARQRATSRILFFEREKSEAARGEEARLGREAEERFGHSMDDVATLAAQAEADDEALARDAAAAAAERALLEQGNPRLALEVNSSGASAVPRADGRPASPYDGHVDDEVVGLRRRRSALDGVLAELRATARQEAAEAEKLAHESRGHRRRADELRGAMEEEQRLMAEERRLAAEEEALLEEGAALVSDKTDGVTAELERGVAALGDAVAEVRARAPWADEAGTALAQRQRLEATRAELRRGWAADAASRRARQAARLEREREWLHQVRSTAGLPHLPERADPAEQRSVDALSCELLRGQCAEQRAAIDAERAASAAASAECAARAGASAALVAMLRGRDLDAEMAAVDQQRKVAGGGGGGGGGSFSSPSDRSKSPGGGGGGGVGGGGGGGGVGAPPCSGDGFAPALERAFWHRVQGMRQELRGLKATGLRAAEVEGRGLDELGKRLGAERYALEQTATAALEAAEGLLGEEEARLHDEREAVAAAQAEERERQEGLLLELGRARQAVGETQARCDNIDARLRTLRLQSSPSELTTLHELDPAAARAVADEQTAGWGEHAAELRGVLQRLSCASEDDADDLHDAEARRREVEVIRRDMERRQLEARRVKAQYEEANARLPRWLEARREEQLVLTRALDVLRDDAHALHELRRGTGGWFDAWNGAPIATTLEAALAQRAQLRREAEAADAHVAALTPRLEAAQAEASRGAAECERLEREVAVVLAIYCEVEAAARRRCEDVAAEAEDKLRQYLPAAQQAVAQKNLERADRVRINEIRDALETQRERDEREAARLGRLVFEASGGGGVVGVGVGGVVGGIGSGFVGGSGLDVERLRQLIAELGRLEWQDASLSVGHALDWRDPDSHETALLVACGVRGLRTPEVAERLLKRGADPNVRGPGDACPLHAAAACGHHEAAALLHDHRADLGARDGLRRTPLHIAAAALRQAQQAQRSGEPIDGLSLSGAAECVAFLKLMSPGHVLDEVDKETAAEQQQQQPPQQQPPEQQQQQQTEVPPPEQPALSRVVQEQPSPPKPEAPPKPQPPPPQPPPPQPQPSQPQQTDEDAAAAAFAAVAAAELGFAPGQHGSGALPQVPPPPAVRETPTKEPEPPTKEPGTPPREPETPPREPETPQREPETPQREPETPQREPETPQRESETPPRSIIREDKAESVEPISPPRSIPGSPTSTYEPKQVSFSDHPSKRGRVAISTGSAAARDEANPPAAPAKAPAAEKVGFWQGLFGGAKKSPTKPKAEDEDPGLYASFQ